ncbi:MAG: 3-dehydroquinate synthase [Flavobacteriales bacterium]|nr:3-dehydroquinate synthase [Flavobacteriales bacterium]MCB0759385.1 3-dehydroquinate synthase [Flavobacteriales bacterium]
MASIPPQAPRIMMGDHPVLMGEHALAHLDLWLAEHARGAQRFVLGDENTLDQCLPELLAHVPGLRQAKTIQVRSGEDSKDLEVCRALWAHLAGHAADRSTLLVNLGGGVVTDLGGFVAATYKRGIRFIHVPTTVMGMVDAAIGGKSAIDLNGVKNLVGVFADPEGTYVHPPFLRTLGKREVLNGVAEMVKHGLVRDAAHWNEVRRAPLHDLDALAPLIMRSSAIKAEVVMEDPREAGPRKLLNFGHSIGHGLEAFALESQQRSLLHGEAVAIGMVCATWLSWRTGLLDRDRMNAVEEHLMGLFPRFKLQESDSHRIIELMRNDKKNVGDEFRFTLLTGIGSARVDVPINAAQVAEALEHYRLLTPDAHLRHHPQT